MAKSISVATTLSSASYETLPGSTGTFTLDGTAINDTIFGQTFQSSETGLLKWSVTANSHYKGYAGYVATIKKSGTSTAMTGEAMTLVSGKTYQISTASKEVWDRTATFTVYDGVTDVTAQVESYDYLFGKVTFLSSYTVVGSITVDGSYLPTTAYGTGQSFTLTQNANAIDTTDYDTAQANGGFMTYTNGLRTVKLDISGFFNTSNGFKTLLAARSEIIIEINPDGAGNSLCRGFFKPMTTGQSGDVGAQENETVSFELSVPYSATSTISPFSWYHSGSTLLPAAIQTAMDAWQNETTIFVKYLHDGTNGWKGESVLTDISMSSGLSAMNTFNLTFEGSGAYTAVP